MSELAFALTPELSIFLFAAHDFQESINKQYGVQSFFELSESSENARRAQERVLERAGLHIQKLFQLTGNMAVAGDKLFFSFPDILRGNRLEIAWREISHDDEYGYLAVSYFIGLEKQIPMLSPEIQSTYC